GRPEEDEQALGEPRPGDRRLRRHRPAHPAHNHQMESSEMPKNKTHSGASKRYKTTGTGKLRRMQAGRKSGAAFASAPTTGSRKKHRQKGDTVEVSKADTKAAKKLLGR